MFNLKALLISGGFLPEPRKVFHLYLFMSGAKWGDGLWQPQFSVCLCTYRIPAVLPGAWQGCNVGLQRLVDVVGYINNNNLST